MIYLRRPCFFNNFSANLSAERLKLPGEFVRHMEGRRSGSVSLIGPSWDTWPVDLIHQDDYLFFDRGWPAFVRDNFIECGDLLVFRYDGELHFTVQVFDQSGCEKEAAFNSKSPRMGLKRDREEVFAPSDKGFQGLPKKIRECCSDFELDCIDDHREADSCEETRRFHSLFTIFALPSQSKTCNIKPEAATQSKNNVEAEMDTQLGGNLRMMMALDEEKAGRSFNSCLPHFVRIMRKFNISGSYTLKIPYKFAMAHLPDCKTEIVLRNLKGECWTVNSLPDSKGRRVHTFCGGWMAFVRGNDIKIGDVCIFELISKHEMRVHITDVGIKELGLQSGKSTSNESSTVDHPPLYGIGRDQKSMNIFGGRSFYCKSLEG